MKWDLSILLITAVLQLMVSLLTTLAAATDSTNAERKMDGESAQGLDRIFTVTGRHPEMHQIYYSGGRRQRQHGSLPQRTDAAFRVQTTAGNRVQTYPTQSDGPRQSSIATTAVTDGRHRGLLQQILRQSDVITFVTPPSSEQLQLGPPTAMTAMTDSGGEYNNNHRHHADASVEENKNNKRRPPAINKVLINDDGDSNLVDGRPNNYGDHYDHAQTTSTESAVAGEEDERALQKMIDAYSNNNGNSKKYNKSGSSAVGGAKNETRPNVPYLSAAATRGNGSQKDNDKTSRISNNVTDAKRPDSNDNRGNAVVLPVTATTTAAREDGGERLVHGDADIERSVHSGDDDDGGDSPINSFDGSDSKNETGGAVQNRRPPPVERAEIGFNRRRPTTSVPARWVMGRQRKVQQQQSPPTVQRQTAVRRPSAADITGDGNRPPNDGQNNYEEQNNRDVNEEIRRPPVTLSGDNKRLTLADGNDDDDDDEIREPYQGGYGFEYTVLDEYAGTDFGQWERREPGRFGAVTGQYRVKLPDGRTQTVVYSVDAGTGYRASVTYEGVQHHPVPQSGPPVRYYDSDTSATTGTTVDGDV